MHTMQRTSDPRHRAILAPSSRCAAIAAHTADRRCSGPAIRCIVLCSLLLALPPLRTPLTHDAMDQRSAASCFYSRRRVKRAAAAARARRCSTTQQTNDLLPRARAAAFAATAARAAAATAHAIIRAVEHTLAGRGSGAHLHPRYLARHRSRRRRRRARCTRFRVSRAVACAVASSATSRAADRQRAPSASLSHMR